MNSIIDRYIAKSVLLSVLVVVFLVASVDLVFLLAEELNDLNEKYTVFQALLFVLQRIPTSIYEMLPFTALGGAIIGLGILASNNELLVMQAAGVKIGRIIWAVMKPTLLVMLLSLLLGEYISPRLEQIAQSNRDMLQSGRDVISSGQGSWQKIGNEFIHINAIAPGGERLYGISRYLLDDNRQLLSSSFAEVADYIRDGDGGYWRLGNVDESRLGADAIRTQNYLQLDWRIDLSPELLSVLLVEPRRQSISGLYRFANYFASEGLEAGSYYLAFWKKLLQPLATAALILLAISFVFGSRREATMGYRAFIAICIGLVFSIMQKLLEPASLLYGFSPVIAVLLPIFLSVVIGTLLLQRVR
jgi:lipopolysaccharide export system permease protein